MKKLILIAEDEQDLVAVYRIMLGNRFEVIIAGNGEEAVTLFRKHRPDLTLMDIRMPIKSGDEAIAEILEIDAGARIVAVTAYRYNERDLSVPVLRKGFSTAEFLEVVETRLKD